MGNALGSSSNLGGRLAAFNQSTDASALFRTGVSHGGNSACGDSQRTMVACVMESKVRCMVQTRVVELGVQAIGSRSKGMDDQEMTQAEISHQGDTR